MFRRLLSFLFVGLDIVFLFGRGNVLWVGRRAGYLCSYGESDDVRSFGLGLFRGEIPVWKVYSNC